MKYNRICQILGIEKPVIQGPLSWLTDASGPRINLLIAGFPLRQRSRLTM
ncbi:hypothetical protein GSA07_002913 [Salmonella enterica]|nr:hypothetical protein [Salmonella enterica]